MIPKIIYAVWCGPDPLPAHDNYLSTWADKLPGYEIVLLGDSDIPSSRCTRAARDAGRHVSYAQYGVWSKLYETGGIALDLDVDILRTFDDLLAHGCFLGIENDGPKSIWAACGVVGAEAGHPFIREALDYMDAFDYAHPKVENELGPRMWTNLLAAKGWRRLDVDATVGGVVLLNSKRFYPYSWQDVFTPECVTAETYAVHRWAHTWNPCRKEPVSVVIPCFGQTDLIGEAIDSALAQTVPPKEVIVVDDGCEPALKLSAKHRKAGVRLIRQDNAGVASARNTGIAAATGEWICALDADDRLHPRYIEKLIGRNDVVSPTLETFGGKHPGTWWPGVKHPTMGDFLTKNCAICGSLFRRVWWEKAGGYDEAMRSGYEDWDFWTRVAHAGAYFTAIDEVLFHYRRYPEDRAGVKGSLEHARKHDAEIMAYMREKWATLGIAGKVHSPLTYPVTIGRDCVLDGTTYPKGSRVDRPTALALKAAGQLSDSRIV